MDIFEQDFKRDSFNEFIKEKIDSKNFQDKLFPLRIFNMAKEQHITEEFEKKVVSKIREPDRRKVQRVIKLDDDLAIIESFEKIFGDTEETWYRVYYNGHVDSTVLMELDVAIIQGICIKHGCGEATAWICRMLGMEAKDI